MNQLKTAILTLALAAPAFASTWKSDQAHSKAGFSVKHMMISTVNGELGAVTSTLNLDDKDFTKSTIDATVDITKINTGVEKRDQHLNSPDFFDTAKFPTLSFKSKKIVKAGKNYKVTGDLTIKDKTKEVTLDTEVTGEVVNPFTKATARGVSGTTKINREDWGLTWNAPLANSGVMVSKEVAIRLDVEFVKEEAAKAEAPAPAAPEAKTPAAAPAPAAPAKK